MIEGNTNIDFQKEFHHAGKLAAAAIADFATLPSTHFKNMHGFFKNDEISPAKAIALTAKQESLPIFFGSGLTSMLAFPFSSLPHYLATGATMSASSWLITSAAISLGVGTYLGHALFSKFNESVTGKASFPRMQAVEQEYTVKYSDPTL